MKCSTYSYLLIVCFLILLQYLLVNSSSCILLCCFLSCIVVPKFNITPTSVNATLGSNATFNCSVKAGVVVWIFNGSQLSQLNLGDIRAYQVQNIFCLMVPAIVKYNNTEVVCSATIAQGNDTYSDPVILRIQGICPTHVRCYSIRRFFLNVESLYRRFYRILLTLYQLW